MIQSTVAEEERVDKVIYRGKLIDIDDLPPSDFNQPWRGTLTIDTTFPQLRLNWTQILSYTAGQYSRVGKSDVVCPGGHELCGGHVGNIIEYNDEKHSGALLLDWRFSYKQPTFKDQYLEFTLDVNNVLNKRISVSSTSRTKTYKMGRNFWFGVSYNW
ncbi:TonB-dependent receptor [Aggregatibacter kilianii]|uniref:TonB-dependent receptor n=1 Tax=Aggregatibacter kilianii TaxID=2025884 RepID=UPI000D64D9F7|nr:TonB-dependent receptor [Aggregatibacter kilianii]